ncbi:MAG: hypothetical protein E7323_13680, partial [Clostridiales bacterium]|nr:hypothetical protein [Clostridiales bacterium]
MMKKCFALLLVLALSLCAACAMAEAAPVPADDGWYLETALDLAEKMGLLADNEAYVELFIGMGQDTDGFADLMAQLSGLEPDEVVTYAFREDALKTLAAAYQMD